MTSHEPPGPFSRTLLRWAPWLVGTLLSYLLWPYISLPFHPEAPGGGIASRLGDHPLNDLLRFGIALCLPLLLLCFTRLFRPIGPLEPPSGSTTESVPYATRFPLWLGLLAILLAWTVPTYHSSGPFDAYHEGESLGSTVSWQSGAKPYQDLIVGHGVVEDPLRSILAFRLWGPSIGAARAFQSILKTFLWLCLALSVWFLLGRKPWRVALTLCAMVCLYPGGWFRLFLAPWDPTISWSTSFLQVQPWIAPFEWVLLPSRHLLFFAFLALIGFGASRPLKGPGLLATSCLFALLPTLGWGYSIDLGFYLSALFIFVFPLAILFTPTSQRKTLALGLSIGVVTGVLVLHFLLRGAWSSFFFYVFAIVPRYKEWTDGIPYPIRQPGFFLALLLVSTNLYRVVLHGFGVTAQLGSLRQKIRMYLETYGLETLFTTSGLLLFRNAIGRGDWEHVIYGLAPSLLAAMAAVSRHRVWDWLSEKISVKTTVHAIVSIFAVMAFLRVTLGGGWERNFPVHEPDGRFLTVSQQKVLSALQNQMVPGDRFFDFASQPAWYYLLGQVSPTRFPGIWFAWTPAFQQEAVHDLEAKKVRWVLYRNGEWSSQVDGISNPERLPIIDQYLKTHYHPCLIIEGNDIWIRNS